MAVETTTLTQTLADSQKRPNKLRSIKFPRLSFLKASSKRSRSKFSCLSINPANDNSSPEQLSPVEMPDISPNYMKVTTSYDAKKGTPQRGIESVDVISIDSSTSRSLAAELSAEKKDGKLKSRPVMKKIMKNFGSTRSFRKRSRSTIKNPTTKSESDYAASPQNSSSVEVSDSSSYSCHYRKTTSCSEGNTYSQTSLPSCESTSIDSSDQSRSPQKSLLFLPRTSSLRSVKILINKASFKSKRGSSKCSQIPDKATCSSTLKGSKFPKHVELQSGQTESDRMSKFKVCTYHHCSLHGGHYVDQTPPVKHIYRRRRLLKSQKSIRMKSESRDGEKFSANENTALENTELSPSQDAFVYEASTTREDAGFLEANEAIEYPDLVEIAFGETSFPEQSYQETLNIMSKYGDFQSTFFTASKCCDCVARERNESTSVSEDVDSNDASSEAPAPSNHQYRSLPLLVMPVDSVGESKKDVSNNRELPKNGQTIRTRLVLDMFDEATGSNANHQDRNLSLPVMSVGSVAKSKEDESNERELSKNGQSTIRTRLVLDMFDEATGSNAISSVSAGNMQEKDGLADPNEDLDSTSFPVVDSQSKNCPPLEVAELTGSTKEMHKQSHPKKKRMSMWNLIRRHMVSDASAESENNLSSGADEKIHQDAVNKSPSAESSDFSEIPANEDAENQEIELQKLFTIKLVREAIEKILLPEVQSDDQSVTSESSADQEPLEKNHSEESTKENFKESDNEEADAASKTETLNAEDIEGSEKETTRKEVNIKSGKRAPKHWSNLKKWILLQRFIKEMEKVRKINPRKPRYLQLNSDPEAEKVNLIPQTADERKRGEEWMLDYALQQAISQLAPTQQRKVELLIKAFETVVPPQGANSQVAFSKPIGKSETHLQITSKETELVNGGGKKVIARIDINCEENDCSMYKNDDIQQSKVGKKLDEVTSASNDEVLVEGEAQKEDQEDECTKRKSELQIDVSRENREKEGLDGSNDSRKEASSNISSLANAVDGAQPKDMYVSSVSECEATENVTISSDRKVQKAEDVEVRGSHKSTAVDLHSPSPIGRSVVRDRNLELYNHDIVSCETSDVTCPTAEGNKNSFTAVSIQNSTSACDAAMQKDEAVVETAKECEKKPKVVRGFATLLLMSDPKDDDAAPNRQVDKGNYISMWHMISQHVLSDVASKVGNEILDGTDDEEEDSITPAEMKSCKPLQDFMANTKDDADTSRDDHDSSHHGRSFCRDDAVKLIREAVNEILTTPIQDDSSDTQSVTSEIIPDQEFLETEDGAKHSSNSSEESLTSLEMSEGEKISYQKTKAREANTTAEEERAVAIAKNKPEPPKSKNWTKLKKLILLKRSIKALERARKFNPRAPQLLDPIPDQEPEKVDLRHQMTDERKKAEKWMLDYAMQHTVAKLTPARKRRVAMLVEAFEAVVPLPEF